MRKRPYVLTIAGFDPSSGAGLTADIKAFEALKCYGLAVCTANTVQNDIKFESCYWTDIEIVKNQIELVFNRFSIDFVKIGIVENWVVLEEIVDFLIAKNPTIKIIVDPVLKSSSDYDFHRPLKNQSNQNEILFDRILNKIYLLTPNYNEIKELYSAKSIEETIKHISEKTNLLLKGGHAEKAVGKDTLFTKEEMEFSLNPKMKNISEKHGSGCVLSAAITAQLAVGFSLLKACYRAKRYTEKVLSSNTTLLGYHNI